MRYTAVSIVTDMPIRLQPHDTPPPDTKFMYYPRIRCLDCPGKLYTTGPGTGLSNFEIHLKNRLHLERVANRHGIAAEATTSSNVQRQDAHVADFAEAVRFTTIIDLDP